MTEQAVCRKTLLDDFFRRAQQQNDAIALVENETTLRYGQLAERIRMLAARITPYASQRVIIALDRGINASIAVLATLTAGGCYIPVDMKSPGSRLTYISHDADAQLAIGAGKRPDWLPLALHWLDMSVPNPIDDTAQHTRSEPATQPDSLAAILYTSGSTGTPKGVALSHRAMANFADWAASTFNISQHDRIASLAPFYFDLSVFDLFTGLSRGATLHFVPGRLTLSPSRLTHWLQQQSITVWYTVPSLLNFIAYKGNLNNTPLPTLRTLLFAGEVMPTRTLQMLCKQLSQVDYYNLYGPTETNVCCYWPVQKDRLNDQAAIPIGLPACSAELKIDRDNHELLVKCDNNFSGYWEQGQLTPAPGQDGFYPTGDKASLNEHGEYCYHGRLDRMLKCSGYRVEPAEIERIILLSGDVQNCAVIGIDDPGSGQRPAAALVTTAEGALRNIAAFCRQQLPAYMQPSRYMIVSELPSLHNGKIDYLALQQQFEQSK